MKNGLIHKEKLDIIVVAGQSNAQGSGVGDVTKEYEKNERVLRMSDDPSPYYIEKENGEICLVKNIPEKIEVAVADEPVRNGDQYGDLSLTFAENYAKYVLKPDRKILIINAGVGGAGFSPNGWGLGNELYERLLKMVKEALSYNEQNRIVALLWHQGENDSVRFPAWDEDKRYQVHKSNLITMMNDFKKIFGLKDIPFVAGGFCDEWYLANKGPCDAVLHAVKDCCEVMQGVFVSTTGLLSNNQKIGNGDDIHFCRESLHILGEKYYDAFTKIINNKI